MPAAREAGDLQRYARGADEGGAVMTDVLQFLSAWAIAIEAWAIDHWLWILLAAVGLGGAAMVRSATAWALRRVR